jgi:acetyl-CoA carboxylase biotin carboxyl carrier protein
MAREEVLASVPGTLYRRPDPDSDLFVEEGAEVAVGQTIALVEVMKNFYELQAEVEGTLVEFLVENEDVVEGGQAVAVIETA